MDLAQRRAWTSTKIINLRNELKEAEALAAARACVYATGSYGRGEPSSHSDLDLFILAKNEADGKSLLRKLDEIRIKADLIEVTKRLGFKDFSRDGQYLEQHTLYEFTNALGTEHDDVTNTFTARLLLLLESCPLVEASVHEQMINDVVAAYWRDYQDHKSDFLPAFLSNDILRLWRTFCVNYEARTTRRPDLEKAKGKIHNFKLKHSRMLTCYSALLCLLAIYGQQKTVHPTDALAIIRRTPTERLEWLRDLPHLASSRNTIDALLDQYAIFLKTTDAPQDELVTQFLDREISRRHFDAASKFGELMFDALNSIGQGNTFQQDFSRVIAPLGACWLSSPGPIVRLPRPRLAPQVSPCHFTDAKPISCEGTPMCCEIVTAAGMAAAATPDASYSERIAATYVTPVTCENLTCRQIGEERSRVSKRAAEVAGVRHSQATKDGVNAGVAIVVYWPAAFFVGGDRQSAEELGRKGEADALEQVSIKKNCGILFRQG